MSRLGFEQGVGVGGAHTMAVKRNHMRLQLEKRSSRPYKLLRKKKKSLKRNLKWAEEKSSGPSYVKSHNQPTMEKLLYI